MWEMKVVSGDAREKIPLRLQENCGKLPEHHLGLWQHGGIVDPPHRGGAEAPGATAMPRPRLAPHLLAPQGVGQVDQLRAHVDVVPEDAGGLHGVVDADADADAAGVVGGVHAVDRGAGEGGRRVRGAAAAGGGGGRGRQRGAAVDVLREHLLRVDDLVGAVGQLQRGQVALLLRSGQLRGQLVQLVQLVLVGVGGQVVLGYLKLQRRWKN